MKKVMSSILKENPPTQRFIASKLGMSSGIQNILEPIFKEEIPTLYGKNIDEVEFFMDKGSSRTSKSTAVYLAKKESETGKNQSQKKELLSKSRFRGRWKDEKLSKLGGINSIKEEAWNIIFFELIAGPGRRRSTGHVDPGGSTEGLLYSGFNGPSGHPSPGLKTQAPNRKTCTVNIAKTIVHNLNED
ncbi:hypothetical protein TNCV_4374161 [Trichonephila clavipes]|uniref:Uncharacterized protein n=1 Tax=Trichonephila clavipes TaxID=2585209 RepID=A0A8X6R9Z8_TRICX|nr:hypothetical protein TNCV_4374161 [Trichonephila clavipes]